MSGVVRAELEVTFPDRVQAVASIHAGRIATDAPESAHHLAAKMRARVYLGVADEDDSCTPEQQAMLTKALSAAHVDFTLELYSGKKHGFAVSDHGVYDKNAAERHFTRLATFFAESSPG